MSKSVIHSDKAPKAAGPYEQAIRTGNLIFVSGQLGLDPASGSLASGVEAQACQALENVGAILREAGSGYGKAVKCTVFLTDMADFAAVNAIYAGYFEGGFPARTCVQVGKLPLGGLVEVECIAEV